MRYMLIFLALLSIDSIADDFGSKAEGQLRRLRKKAPIELCQRGCEAEITDILQGFIKDNVGKTNYSVDKFNGKLILEKRRCERKCEIFE
jgi:hypothetical protein